MRKRVLFVLVMIFAAVLMQQASAEIILGQTDSFFNVGDILVINITTAVSGGSSDFLLASLVCDSGEIEVYKSPLNLGPSESRITVLSAKLDSLLLRNLGGMCHIKVNYAGETKDSQVFEISRKINVQFFLNGITDPGKEVPISGSATKANGQKLQGVVEVSIPDLGLNSASIVNNGIFNLSISIPRKASSGNHEVIIRVYDKDDLKAVANEGTLSSMIRVKQVIERVDVALEKEEIIPGEKVVYTPQLFDQSEKQAVQEVQISIVGADGVEKDSFLVSSGNANSFSTQPSFVPGTWTLKAKYGSMEAQRSFVITELENLSFLVVSDTLTVTNVGNVPFSKAIKISIGDNSEIKTIDLPVGGIKKYKLSAPDGTYSISAIAANATHLLGSFFLTGHAIEIKEFDSSNGSTLPILFWCFAVLIVLSLTVFFVRRVRKKKYYGYEPSIKSAVSERPLVQSTIGTYKSLSESRLPPLRKMETYGKKEKVAVVALNIRNISELEESGGDGFSVVSRIIQEAKLLRARYKDERDYKLFIFAPSIMKELQIGSKVLSFIKRAEQTLTDYNKKHALKVQCGIGANVGEMIVEAVDGHYKLSAFGSLVILAKKAASRSKGESLIAASMRKEYLNLVRGEALPGMNFWRLDNVINREPHREFLDRFSKRNFSQLR